jgi:hypothetical protein
MSRRFFSVSEADGGALRRAVNIVTSAVRARRSMGHKNEYAIEQAAMALGMTPRRIAGLMYGEVFRLASNEYLGLMARWGRDIDQQISAMRGEAERMEQHAEHLRIADTQLSLDLGEPPCSTISAGSFGLGWRGGISNAGK